MKEIKIVSHLRHQNIVTFYGVIFESDETEEYGVPAASWPVVVLERAEYGTLDDVLLADMAFDTETALGWMAGVASAIFHLHDHFIVHGDIKPNNILFGRGMTPKLADFGSSLVGASDSDEVAPSGTGATREWEAPESEGWRRLGSTVRIELGKLADLYSLGIVLAVCCCLGDGTEKAISLYRRIYVEMGHDEMRAEKLASHFRERLEIMIANQARHGAETHLQQILEMLRAAIQPEALHRDYAGFRRVITHYIPPQQDHATTSTPLPETTLQDDLMTDLTTVC
jgi:serine/threonine protein kinase